MLEKCKCEIKKKYIKKNYKKMERKKIMTWMLTWMLTWLNVSAAALNATFQLLVIYRYRFSYSSCLVLAKVREIFIINF